jgi:hypothetical protein
MIRYKWEFGITEFVITEFVITEFVINGFNCMIEKKLFSDASIYQ